MVVVCILEGMGGMACDGAYALVRLFLPRFGADASFS